MPAGYYAEPRAGIEPAACCLQTFVRARLRSVVNTHEIGDRSETMIMARLLQSYACVLIPFGSGHRYDLVVDTGQRFLRIQCKTGRLRNGCIYFRTASNHYHRSGGGRRDYRGQIEFFGVYCPENDKVYLVPVEDVKTSEGAIRVDPARNNQQQGIRFAEPYELHPGNAPT